MQNEPQLKNWGKSLWTGGLLGAFLSVMPFVNLLNMFFLFWLALAGGVTVHLLLRHNQHIRFAEALISGALSGLIGSTCFSLITGLFLFNLTPEKLQQLVSHSRLLSAAMEQDFIFWLQSGRFKMTLLVILSLFILFSIVAGSIGGLISRQIFGRRFPAPPGNENRDGGNR